MHTYICYPCMESRRCDPMTNPVCPKCRSPMIELNYKIRIPKRRRKLWIKFRSWLGNTYPYYKGKLDDKNFST